MNVNLITSQYYKILKIFALLLRAPRQPHSNREKELQKYYALLQFVQGCHPLPCSTMLWPLYTHSQLAGTDFFLFFLSSLLLFKILDLNSRNVTVTSATSSAQRLLRDVTQWSSAPWWSLRLEGYSRGFFFFWWWLLSTWRWGMWTKPVHQVNVQLLFLGKVQKRKDYPTGVRSAEGIGVRNTIRSNLNRLALFLCLLSSCARVRWANQEGLRLWPARRAGGRGKTSRVSIRTNVWMLTRLVSMNLRVRTRKGRWTYVFLRIRIDILDLELLMYEDSRKLQDIAEFSQ